MDPIDLRHLGNERVIGSYLVETDDGLALHDCGPSTTVAGLKEGLASRGLELRPVSHDGSFFWPPGVPTYTATSDLIRTRAQGESVSRALGGSRAIFLRNHGVAVVGGSIAEATYAAILLERAAEIQLLAQPAREASFFHTDEDEARRKRDGIFYPGAMRASFDYFARKHGHAVVDR